MTFAMLTRITRIRLSLLCMPSSYGKLSHNRCLIASSAQRPLQCCEERLGNHQQDTEHANQTKGVVWSWSRRSYGIT